MAAHKRGGAGNIGLYCFLWVFIRISLRNFARLSAESIFLKKLRPSPQKGDFLPSRPGVGGPRPRGFYGLLMCFCCLSQGLAMYTRWAPTGFNPMGPHGSPWISMDFLWVPTGSHGFPWVPMGTHGYPWVPHGFPWIPMGSHGFPRWF